MHWSFRLRRYLVFLRHLLWEAYKERILLSIVATTLFGTLISILNKATYGSRFWERFPFESDIDKYFCEYTDMSRLIRQPVNTFTNFVYLVIAIFCFTKGMEDIKRKRAYNLITANRFYSFTLSVIMLYTFIGSTLFHSSLITFCSKLDFSAVYSITLFPLMYFVHRVTLNIRNKPTNIRHSNERIVMIIAFSVLYILLSFTLDMGVVHPIVGTIILSIILLGFYLEHRNPGYTNKDYLITTVVSIILAGIFFEFDIKHIMCGELGRVSPHSLWHIFNGLSIFFFYLYIRSEGYDHTQDDLRLLLKMKADDRVSGRK